MRLSLSLLGTEVLAFEFGASEGQSEPLRYDPTSTTACQTETVYADPGVVCSEFGFRGDRDSS